MVNKSISKKAWMLLAVTDMKRAKNFYETVMEQKVESENEGYHVTFESGIALQYDYAGLVEGNEHFASKPTGAKIKMKPKSNSTQISFEVKDLDYWLEKIKSTDGIEIIHDITKYHWGQRAIRFYDYDGHIIEFGECLEVVARRFLAQGLTVEEVAESFGYPLDYVQQLLSSE